MVLALVVLLPWGLVAWIAFHHFSAALTQRDAMEQQAPPSHHEVLTGPWGVLDVEPIVLDFPSSQAIFELNVQPYRRWVFAHKTHEALVASLEKAGLTPADRDRLLAAAVPDKASDGYRITAPDDLVRGLSPVVRAALYTQLARGGDNPGQTKPFMFRGASVDEWFAHSGVKPETVEMIRPLVYRRANYLLFSDPQLVMPRLHSSSERITLFRALYRTATLRIRVGINPGDSPAGVLDYWGRPNRYTDVEPLLSALASADGGISILTLLPPFPRSRLYQYLKMPQPQVEDSVVRDCHWASFNFFNEEPDDHIAERVLTILSGQYERINSPTQFGDVVMVFDGDTLVHSCVYLAGDIVFTKNGVGAGSPFVLEHLDDIVDLYRAVYGEIQLGFCRRKGL